ncbi:hypothetical protein [Aeoliella mucimassa]|uniref:Uncharacterized protein n=1 Tax=Aeoliella mucimassa TaxID=2527972 RepID=A0A518ATY0_9BACT|nr:hypothetical protein [Aeoliella mucimassa]QDU58194.1 hypothetical protein Pan181_44270 [Aeoliella mucimassa]
MANVSDADIEAAVAAAGRVDYTATVELRTVFQFQEMQWEYERPILFIVQIGSMLYHDLHALWEALEIDGVREALDRANDYPAVVAGCPGNSFTEATYSAGIEILDRLTELHEGESPHWSFHQIRDRELPPPKLNLFWLRRQHFNTLANSLRELEPVPPLNRFSLSKELKRATSGRSSLPRPSYNEDRDRFIYEERMKVPPTPYSEIRKRIKQVDGWSHLGSDPGARRAAQNYVEKHRLPPMPSFS